MGYFTPLFLAAFVASAYAVPTGLRHTCAQTCADTTKFAFERGMSYEYDYKVQTTTTNSPKDFETQAAMTVTSKAKIGVLAPCEYILTLSDVVLEGSSLSSEFGSALIKKPLRFAFDDGRISEVCSDSEEEAWVINFKRGVLSAFQNTMSNFQGEQSMVDVDVTGECETLYKVSPPSESDTFIIERTKSPDSCKRMPTSAITTLPTALQRLPLISADQKCTQKIVAGIVTHVKCDETLLMRPVSGTEGGATTAVSTELTLVTSTAGVQSADFNLIASSMEFDSRFDSEKTAGYFRTIEALLQELDSKSMPMVQSQVPALFTKLVEELRQLDQGQLGQLYEANRGTRVWNFLVDAAPLVATPASTAIVAKLITSGQMTQEEASVWFTSLAFVTSPKVEMFPPLTELLLQQFSKKALLGISGMINVYCKIDSSCTEQSAIREVLSAIEVGLGSACRSTNFEEKERILVTLKALGNAGHWMNVEVMNQCFSEIQNPIEIRVMALESWGRAPCSYDRSGLLNVYTNSREDSEVRIAAYLSLMTCPNQDIINIIKDRLVSESVNQVGSFVWTHLSNLQESASHGKQWIRSMIGEDMLVNKFNTSSLKFSRNFESSFYMNELGLGSTVDSNLIFSSKSFLPRSAMFNLTLDLFGESINMFEVGGRFEGFEVFAEKFFGPQGYYPEETVEGILKSLRQSKIGDETTIEHLLDVITEEPEGSYFLRVLGNDLQYHHFRGIENFFEEKTEFNFLEMLMELAKKGNVDYTKSYKLIDTELSYPTISGLPLTLKLNSTATLGLRMDGKFAIRSYRDIDIEGHVYPSAVLQVDATMLMDANVAKTGIKVSSNVHTSSFMNGNLKIEGGKVIDIALNLPQDKIELINVKSKTVFIENDVKKVQDDANENGNFGECIDTDVILGVKWCAGVSVSPFESRAAVWVEKTDSLTGYSLRFLKESDSISFLVDTPGSRRDRKLSFVVIKDDQEVKIDIHTPWKSVKAAGTYIVSESGRRYEFEAIADSTRQYQVSVGHSSEREGPTLQFKPFLMIKSPSSIIVDAEGSFESNSKLRLVKVNLENRGIMPASIKLSTSFGEDLKKFEAEITSSVLTVSASGNIQNNDRLASQLDIDYAFMGQPEQQFRHNFKYEELVNEQDKSYSGAFLFQASEFPSVTVNTKGKLHLTQGRVEASGSVNIGGNRFDLSSDNTLAFGSSESSTFYDARITLVSSSHNIDALLTEKFKLQRNYLLREAYLRLTPAYELKSKTEMAYKRDVDGYARIHFSFMDFDVTQEISYKKIANKYYTAQVLGRLNGDEWNFDGSYQDRSISGESVDLVLGVKSKVNYVEGEASIGIKADRQRGASVEAKANYGGIEKFAKVVATTTSLELDSNIFKHITLLAKVQPDGPIKSVEVKGVWDKLANPTDIVISGKLEERSITGLFKLGDTEKRFRGDIDSTGVKVEVHLGPSQTILGRASYDISQGLTLAATLETPFSSYEKQDAMISFKKLANKEFSSQISVVWRNAPLVAMSASGKVESNYLVSEMAANLSVTCDETIFGVERIVFNLNHQRNRMDIDSSISRTVDGNEIVKGFLKKSFSTERRDIEASLVTPFSEDFSFKSEHELLQTGKMELKYGNDNLVSAYSKNDLQDKSGMQLEYTLTSTVLDNIRALATYRDVDTKKTIEIEANYGEKKYMVSINLEKQVSGVEINYIGNGRIIMPHMAPITGSLTTTLKDENQVICEFEMTKFWSSYGNFKVHSSVNVQSATNLQFLATLTSPDTRASIDTMFKYESNKVDFFAKGVFNGAQTSITLRGFADLRQHRAKLVATAKDNESTVFKITIAQEHQDNTRITKLNIKRRGFNYDITHHFTFSDNFNWNNKFQVNDMYFNNDMKYENSLYSHRFDWNFGGPFISGEGSFSYERNGRSLRLDGEISATSSWTSDIKTEIKYESDGSTYKPEVVIEYGPSSKISVSTIFSCLPEKCSLKVNLETSFWEATVFEGAIELSSVKSVKLFYSKCSHTANVDIGGVWRTGEKAAKIEIASSLYLPHPIKIEAGMENNGEESTILFALNATKIYRGELTYARLSKQGKLSGEIELPCIHWRKFNFSLDYDCSGLPGHVNLLLSKNDRPLTISATLREQAAVIEVVTESKSLKAESSWSCSSTNGLVKFNVSSPNDESMDVNAQLEYNLPNKFIDFIVKNDSKLLCKVTIGRKSGNDSLLDAQFSHGISQGKLLLSYDESNFEGLLVFGQKTVELVGTYTHQPESGEYSMNISTPFPGLESISSSMTYNFGTDKNIDFKFAVGTDEISLVASANVSDWHAPEVSIDVTTTLDQYRSIGGGVKYNVVSATKFCEIDLHRNNEVLSWKLEILQENSKAGKAFIRVFSPFVNYELFELGLEYSLSEGSYQGKVHQVLNAVRNEYLLKLTLSSNSLSGEIIPSTEEGRKLSFTGEFENDSMKSTASLKLNIDDEATQIVGELIKDLSSPKVNILITSPYETYRNVEFHGNYKIGHGVQTFESSLKTPMDLYSIGFEASQQYKQGEFVISLVTPLPGYSSIGFKGRYNFIDNTKAATMEFDINGQVEAISVDLQLNDNNVIIAIESPFPDFRQVTFTGDMTYIDGKRTILADIQNGSNRYSVSGEVNISDMYFQLRTDAAQSQYGSLEISGQKTQSGYTLHYTKDGQEKKIILEYNMKPTAASMKIQTPFSGFRNVALAYSYQKTRESFSTAITFEKDEIKFHCTGDASYSDFGSSIVLKAEIPSMDQKIVLKANYDISHSAKQAELSARYNSVEEKLQITIRYDSNAAAFRVTNPFINEEFGAEYKFDINQEKKSIVGSFIGLFNSETYEFTAHAELNSDNLEMKFTTPFEGFERIHASASIDYLRKTVDGRVIFGPYESTLELCYALAQPILEIVTPFEIIQHFKISYSVVFTSDGKKIDVFAAYNQYKYGFSVSYEPNHVEKRVMVIVNYQESYYKFSAGWQIEDRKALLICQLESPLQGLKDIRFTTKVDLANDDKVIEINLQNEEDTKMIALNGKFVGDLIDFRIQTPFTGLRDFRTYGSLSRTKRSLEFDIMNDSSSGAIRASFNSLSVVVKSPYPAARETTLKIEKTDGQGLLIEYKRGDNFFNFTLSPAGRSQTFEVRVNSAIPGWEVLALLGRIDRDDLIAYVFGQINEAKMTIQGSGTFGRREADLKYDITTPYADYQSVTVSLAFNLRRKELNFEAKSATSDFRIIIKSKPSFTVDVFVPNSQEPTIITANITIFKGNLSIQSRFPRLRTFKLDYNVSLGKNEVDITTKIESNSVEIFNLEFKRGGGKAHLKIEARRGDNHSMIHFHRVGFETAEFVFHRNQKEFKVEAQGTGNLPTKGSIDAVINNSFREIPRTVSAHIDVDRSGSPKKIKFEITFPGSKLYIFDLKYNGDLSNPQIGDYNLSITTPQRRAYEWQNISGKWNFNDHDNAFVEFNIGNKKYVARGKFGLSETNIVINSSNPNIEDIILEYRFSKTSTSSERTRDYYLKVGTVSKYLLYTLKGTFSGIEHGEAEHSIQLSRFMPAPVNTKFNWHRDSSGLSGQGSFDYGDYSGTYTLKKIKRDASTHSLVLSFEASTNIPNFSKITVDGEYNFDNQAIFKLDIIWDTSKISINFNINDITSTFTEQTASLSLPSIGDVNVTFGHDFRGKKKTFTVIGKLMERESHLKAEWTSNKDYTKLSGKIDIDSILIGKANVNLQWDVRDINNAKAEIKYTRNEDKNVHIKWVRKFTGAELDAELLFESHFQRLPKAKISVNANFSQGFALNVLMAGAKREIKLILNVGDNSVTGELVSPIPGFEQVNGSLTYNMSNPNNKTATLRYTRGDKKVNMDMNMEITSNQAGKLTVNLETPFEFVRTLSLDASWNNNRGEVHYKRNDISYNFTGQAQVKSDRTSFEVNFTPTTNEPVKIAFSFNAGSLISGDGTEPQEIADIELQMLGKRIAFELKGFRNAERIMIELEAESSLEQLRELEVKLDSEFNTQERNGLFEIKVDDFHFKIRNYFKRNDDGYYLRSEIDSSLTSLPGLIISIGRDGDSRIVTVGIGEDREITVSLVGKENYRKGFSGKVSLPRRGIVDAALDVNYSFSGNDVLNVDIKFELEPGKVIQADVLYNSDGVRARLSSPRSGRHSARARRSVTENGFMVDVGVDDYSFSLRGDLLNSNIKRGFVIEGEVFGRTISIDTLYQSDGSQYKEGKFIIKTSFEGYENLGGLFSFSHQDKQIHGRCEINLPSYFYPKINANIDFDLDGKIKGLGSLNVSGQVFAVHIDLVGSLLDGYDGNIMIRTPFHLASEITMEGHIMVESMKKISASLAVAYPLGSKNIQLNYNIMDKVFAEVRMENLVSGKMLYIKIDHTMKGNYIKSGLTINRSNISLEFRHQLPVLSGELHITSDHFALPVTISFSKEEASMMLTGTFAGQTHVMSGKYQKVSSDIDFSAMINSPLIGNRHLISFKHVMPLNYLSDNFAVQITYTGEATYDAVAKLDRDAGIKATISIDSPSGASIFEVYLQDSVNKTDLSAMVQLPNCEHKAMISVSHFIVQAQAEKFVVPQGTLQFDLELTSTLLVNDVIYSLKVDVSDEKKMTEQMYMFGEFKQTLNAGYSYTAGGVHLVFDIDTPMFDIGKVALSGELNLSNAIKAKIETIIRNESHTFDINIDAEEQEFLIVMKSPMIPGEVAKMEASRKGNASNNLQLALAFRLDKKTFASKLQVNAPSLNNMFSALEVKTPFRGYRKMNFRASFENNETIKVSFFADRPFGYQFEMVSGNSIEGHNSRLDIRTTIEGFETISAVVKIPYAKTAPKFLIRLPLKEYGLDFDVETMEFSRTMSGNLNLNGMAYGGGFGLRTKAPYEFSYHYHVQKLFRRFHIMMDSSFFSVFSLFLLVEKLNE